MKEWMKAVDLTVILSYRGLLYIPQNGGVDSWVMCFHFRGSIKPIFENHVSRPVSEPFHPLYEAKISNPSPSVVYGSITLNFFRGSGN